MASTAKTNEQIILEERKVKALEKIANVLDALTIWFEDVDKSEWSERLQWYLFEFHSKIVGEKEETEGQSNNLGVFNRKFPIRKCGRMFENIEDCGKGHPII